MSRAESLLRKFFGRYPGVPAVRPDSFSYARQYATVIDASQPSMTIALQCVPDPFYFLLFGAILARLAVRTKVRADVIAVRSVSGAFGVGVLAALKRSAPVAWLQTSKWIRAYAALIDGVGYRCATWAHPLRDARDWWRAGALWRSFQSRWLEQEPTLQIDGIEVADLVIDAYLRFRPSAQFDVKDPFVQSLLWQAMRDVRQARAYFSSAKPCLYLTSYSTYLEHGVPVRVALREGVAVWSFGSLARFGKQLHTDDVFHTPDCSQYQRIFDALDHQEERLQLAREQLERRLSGGVDPATSYMRQSAYVHSSVKVPDGLEGAAVIFMHDFYDSPHIYPDLVFPDFWRWICFTIQTLAAAGKPFFLKTHPNQIEQGAAVIGQLRQKYPELNWLPAGITTVQLVDAGMAFGVTVYGTVAHELAYLGVPSIACARHPHNAFDFCRTARTPEAYAELLVLQDQQPLGREKMQRQALTFYYMHNLYGSEEQRALQQSFAAFWKACNVETLNADTMLQRLRAMSDLPAFAQYVDALCGDLRHERVAEAVVNAGRTP